MPREGNVSLPCAPLLAGVPWPLSPRRSAEVKPGDTLQRPPAPAGSHGNGTVPGGTPCR